MPTIRLTKVQAKELSMGLALYIAEINCIDDKDYRKRTKILQRVLDKLPTVGIEKTPSFNSLDEWLKYEQQKN